MYIVAKVPPVVYNRERLVREVRWNCGSKTPLQHNAGTPTGNNTMQEHLHRQQHNAGRNTFTGSNIMQEHLHRQQEHLHRQQHNAGTPYKHKVFFHHGGRTSMLIHGVHELRSVWVLMNMHCKTLCSRLDTAHHHSFWLLS